MRVNFPHPIFKFDIIMANMFFSLLDTRDTVLIFPEKSINQVIEINKPFPQRLKAFTISIWLQPSTKTEFQPFFSYATKKDDNELLLYTTDYQLRVIFIKKQ